MKSIREQLQEQGKVKAPVIVEERYYIEGEEVSYEEYMDWSIADAGEYKWLRVLPEDFYEEGVDVVWCHKKDADEKPVELNDTIEYRRHMNSKYPGPMSLGKVIAIFEGIGQFDKRFAYFGEIYKK